MLGFGGLPAVAGFWEGRIDSPSSSSSGHGGVAKGDK